MNRIKNFISEYKKSLESEEVLVENERRANIVLAIAMFNCFMAQIIICVLSLIEILDIDKNLSIIFLIAGVILLLIPSIVCIVLRGKKKWIKIILIFSFTLVIAVLNSLFTYTLLLSLGFPVLFAARYYSKKFTIFVTILTSIIFAVSVYLGTYIGFTDLNYVDIPKGTTITIETTLEDAVDNLELDQDRKSLNMMEQSFLPNLILYLAIIAFGCSQISKSGERMVKKQKKLSEDKARTESELNIAKNIQKNMLPSIFPAFPQYNEFDIFASMTPAKEVGGDFYDMFLVDDNHLAFVIADVSGKGIPGALIMMTARTLIKNASLGGNSVDEVFNIVNKSLTEGNASSHFVTSWLGIIDLRTGILEFANAGHNPPLIYSKKDCSFKYLKTNPNLILAIDEDEKYQKHSKTLSVGDRIFLYTDGVTEAQNMNDELYSEERLLKYLNDNIDKSVEETIEGVKNDISKFVGDREQFDDITMLEFQFKAKKNEKNNESEKEFNADNNELSNVTGFVESELEKYDFSPKIISQFVLVVEELFVNIASYAYKDIENGKCKLKIEYNKEKKELKLTFEDNGIKFNPLERKDPDLEIPLKDMEIGGFGIFIAKESMDNIEYKYEDKKNILILSKNV